MTKRRVTFSEDVEVKRYKDDSLNVSEPAINNPQASRITYSFKSKHSLDSDEEDADDLKTLPLHEIEGQEGTTLNEYDEIKVTPFNMKDEMDEGHFDECGTFIFKKQTEIRDNWIDNIDWMEIKRKHGDSGTETNGQESDSDSESLSSEESILLNNPIEIYKEMLTYLQPGENVLKGIKRLGKTRNDQSKKYSASASERLQYKKEQREREKQNAQNMEDKAPTAIVDDDTNKDLSMKNMLRLTELCDELLQKGIYDIYDYTFEKLQYLIEATSENSDLGSQQNASKSPHIKVTQKAVDANLNMFDTVD